MSVVFTICSNVQLAHAFTLGDSIEAVSPDWNFVIFLVDKLPEKSTNKHNIIDIQAVQIPHFQQLSITYTHHELQNACKPYCATYLLSTIPNTSYICYFAPKVFIFQPLKKLIELFDNQYDILITPTYAQPLKGRYAAIEKHFLNQGIADNHFWALKVNSNTQRFLHWLSQRLSTKGQINYCEGLGSERLWLMYANIFFEKVLILRHPDVCVNSFQDYDNPFFYHFQQSLPHNAVSLLRSKPNQILWQTYQAKLKANKSSDYGDQDPIYGVVSKDIPIWQANLLRLLKRIIGHIDTFSL